MNRSDSIAFILCNSLDTWFAASIRFSKAGRVADAYWVRLA